MSNFGFRRNVTKESTQLQNRLITLQEACRIVIVRSVTLNRMQQVGDLPIPNILIRKAITVRIPDDFDLEKIFMNYNFSFPNHVHHPSHRIHPGVCKLDGSKVLIKSHILNKRCDYCKVYSSKNRKNNSELWMDIRHKNVMQCMLSIYEPRFGLFCHVLQFPLMTLQNFAYIVHMNGVHIPEYLVWRTLHQLCNVFDYLNKLDMDASDLCQPQHIYLDCDGIVKLENMLLYTQLNGPTVIHSNMASFYNPPEKLTGMISKTDSTQVWGLGCVLYELTQYMPMCVSNDDVTFVTVDGPVYPATYGKPSYSRCLQLVITFCLEDVPLSRPSLIQLKHQSLGAVQHLRKFYNGPTNLLSLYPLEMGE